MGNGERQNNKDERVLMRSKKRLGVELKN